jgi:hypothetical protein
MQILLVLLPVLGILEPRIFVFLIGLLPTLAIWIVDRDPGRYSTMSVAALNLAGMTPALTGLVSIEEGFDGVLSWHNAYLWLFMYGGAALGWAMDGAIPPFVATYLASRRSQRIQRLRIEQRKLIDEWGTGVSGVGED